MLTPKKALAAARVYTQETAQEMGALKGAPCTIKSIVKSGNLNTVTFEWTDRSGVTHESTMLVYDGTPGQDGDDGFSPTIVVKSSTSTEYILTITDKNGSYDTPNLKGSGGSGGASAMSDLTDVDLTALANGSVLVYDSTSAKWEATALSLSDISGIDLTGITDGQILAWDAANSKFVPADNIGEEYTAGEGIEISQDNEISSKIVMYTGTKAAWGALPLADKKKYTHASFTDDTESGVVDSEPTEDSVNLVTSGGVFAALEEKADKTDLDDKADIATTLAGYGITDAYTKTETGNAITAEIEKLDVSDAAVAGSYVTEVSETDGKIAVTREAADAVPTESSNKMVKSGGVYAADKAIYEVMGALGAKNLLLFNLEKIKKANTSGTWAGNVYSIDGLTATFNSDGSISLSGTTSEWRAIKLVTPSFFEVLPADAYTLTGCPSGGSSLTYGLIAQFKDGTTNKTLNDYGSGATDTYGTNVSLTGGNVFVSLYPNIDFTGFTFKPMLRLASDTDSTYQPYSKTNQELTSENEALTNKLNNEIVTRSALGAKNILPFDLADIIALNTNGTWESNVYTYRGVAFTVNSDGTISATGTATGGNASIKIFAASSNYEMLGKEVILTGCPSNGSATTYRIQAYRMASADGSTGTYFDDGAGTDTFTALNNASGTVGSFAVAVYENATVTNLLFKPMVRLASDPDATYQPYAKTNQELTLDNVDWDDMSNIGSVNTLDNIAQTVVSSASGLTATVNSDKTITVTPTSGTYPYTLPQRLIVDLTKAKPDFAFFPCKLSGCPSGGSLNAGTGYQIYYANYVDTNGLKVDAGDGVIITEEFNRTTYPNARIMMRINAGVTLAGPLVFKPMLTPVDYNGPYVPYVMTNRELTTASTTNAKNISTINKGTLDIDAIELTANTPTKVISSYGVYLITFTHGGAAPGGLYLVQVHATDVNGMQVAVIKESTDRTVTFDKSVVNQLTVTASGNGRMRIIKLDASNY